jgi:predicted SnoaL-like aldol condensation-catalyzing enzyme
MKPLIISHDVKSKRNAEAVLAFYDEMINKKHAIQATEKYLVPDYIQHDPIIPTTAKALGEFFNSVTGARKNLRVVVHHIIAGGDWVWAHVNFVNLYNDDPYDRGVAGVDIYRFNVDGKMVEHWDVLQEVPDPVKAANTNGMF